MTRPPFADQGPQGARLALRIGLLGCAALALGACGAAAPFSAAPRLATGHEEGARRVASTRSEAQPVFSNSLHRQYFDKSVGRYYFFDPATRQYYWEDGAPR
jgi:hypothetical protein